MNDKAASPLLAKALTVAVDGDMNFAEPWEAKAFAIIVKLTQSGHFTWPEWVECFSQEVAAATSIEAAGGSAPTYYEQWLNAAETLLVDKQITTREQLTARRFAIGAAGSTHVMK